MTRPIDAAIDEVERQRMEEEKARLEPREPIRVPVLKSAHRWGAESEVTITAAPDEETPTLLVWDSGQGAWRAVFLEASTRWRVVPDRPQLWTPPATGAKA